MISEIGDYVTDLLQSKSLEEKHDFRRGVIASKNLKHCISYCKIESLLLNGEMQYPKLEVIADGRAGSLSNFYDSCSVAKGVAKAISDGHTLRVRNIHNNFETIDDLCGVITNITSMPTTANAYITPRNTRGFNPHFDDHDVIVLQIHGQKDWTISDQESSLKLPLKSMTSVPTVKLQDLHTIGKYKLRVGDVLYIPRGVVHSAESQQQLSIHLTFGLQPVTFYTFLQYLLARKASVDVDLRRMLSPNLLSKTASSKVILKGVAGRLESIFSHLNLADELASFREIQFSSQARCGAGSLRFFADDLATTDLKIFINEKAYWNSSKLEQRGELELIDKILVFDSVEKPIVEELLRVKSISFESVQRVLGDDAMKFCTKLIEEGFLGLKTDADR